jgi:hypothetical protein
MSDELAMGHYTEAVSTQTHEASPLLLHEAKQIKVGWALANMRTGDVLVVRGVAPEGLSCEPSKSLAWEGDIFWCTPMGRAMKCADVTYDMADTHCGEPVYQAELGDLVWNPKMGAGHVIVAEIPCGQSHNGRTVDCGCGGWGTVPCPSTSLICECGQDDSWRDHHYYILARR